MQTTYYPMSTFVQSRVLITLTLFLFGITTFAQVDVRTSKNNATYQTGQTATFNVTSTSSGTVTWELKYDNNAPIISSGSFFLNANQTRTITHFSNEPGVVICKVVQYGNQAIASAAFSPFDIEPFESEPSDFDSFWTGLKNQINGVPSAPVVTYFQSNTYSTSYRVQLNNINNRKVYGYLVVPNGGGPFPAIIELPPYGNVTNLASPAVNLAEQGGVMVLSISIHNAPPDQVDPNAYLPDNFANKNENYYRWGILGAIQSINYLFSRSDFNGTDLGVVGVSQGAGLATIVAGLDNRVTLLAFSNPVLSQNSGLHHNRAGGFPNYVQTSRNSFGTAAHENATVDASRYYDAMFHARRYDGPIYGNLSYEDLVTPAATGFATVNQFSGKKILVHSLELGHSHPVEYWVKRQDFLRRVFPVTLNTHTFPFSSNDQGYWIDAGNDQSISGSSASLAASVEKNGTSNPNFVKNWRKLSGPGNVSFNNSTAYNTTATFSQNGTYVLQFSAVDEAQLFSDKKYFTLLDQVVITVGSGNGGGGGGGGNNGSPVPTLSTDSTNVSGPFQVNASFSENVSGFVLSDLNVTNATTSNLTGSGSNYSFTVTPIADGNVTVVLPLFKVLDNQGNANLTPSNTLVINYTSNENSGGGGGSGGNGDCNNPTNLALNKPATQQSTQFNATAARAVDGNTDGDFWNGNSVALTNWISNAWWEVDLGAVSEISEINIWNRTDCCQDILKNYHILVSDVPFVSTNLSTTINQSGVEDFFQNEAAGTPATIAINRSGRYIRIQLAGQGFLGLAEVEVLGCDNGGGNSGGGGSGGGGNDCSTSENIASIGTATQMSTQFSGAASRAINGDTEGSFWSPAQSVSLTAWETNAWWELDLGSVAEIDDLKIWNRTDCCEDFLNNYYVLISDTPFNSTNLNSTINQSGVFSELQDETAERPSTIPINRTGRYIRIQLSDQGFLALAEVEVNGCIPNFDATASNNLVDQSETKVSEELNQAAKLDFKVYPNPANEKLFINLESFMDKNIDIQIYDARGILRMEKNIEKNANSVEEIGLSNYINGLYIVAIKVDGRKMIAHQFVVARPY